MHSFNVATLFVILVMVGVEFSVSAFADPSAWRLDPEPQSRFLSLYAAVLGKVMPFWYAGGLVLLGVETWLYRHTSVFTLLLAASTIWFLTTLATMLFLVPLNNRVIEGGADSKDAHRSWDRRHRVRIVALAAASLLLTYAVMC